MNDVLQWLISIHFATVATSTLAVAGALGALWKIGKTVLRGLRRVTYFLDQWMGEDAHNDMPAVPGVLGRLTAIEVQQVTAAAKAAEVAAKLAAVDHELRPNSGGSMFDKLTRGQRELVEGQTALQQQLQANADTLTAHLLDVANKGSVEP